METLFPVARPSRQAAAWIMLPVLAIGVLMIGLLLVTWPVLAAPGHAPPDVVRPLAPTYVGGSIVTSTTWISANNPYIVTDTVIVENNAVLTIEPGVVVSFTAATGLQIGDGAPGRLEAQGTAEAPILFTAPAPGGRGAWLGIQYSADSPGNVLRYCVIEYAGTAVTAGDSDSHVIDHCILRYNGDADTTSGGALRFDGDGLQITFNEVYSNDLGLRFRKSNSDTITSNLVYNNDDAGIEFAAEIGDGGSNNVIAYNQILHNGGNGLTLDQGYNNRVEYNTMYANGGDGIWIDRQGELSIYSNVVRGNWQNGVTHVPPGGWYHYFGGNVFCGNMVYDVDNRTVIWMQAYNTWWGTNEPAPGLNPKIHGAVNVAPWISLAVSADVASLPADGASTATVTVTLRGPDYPVPDGYTLTLAVSDGSITPAVISLVDGQATATYTAGDISGTVTITASDYCTAAVFSGVLTLTQVPVDLAVTKTAGPLTVDADKRYWIDYTITVSNVGAITATDVIVTDTLPVQALPLGGAWSCAGGVCSQALGPLGPTGAITALLHLRLDLALIECPIVLTNTVEVADGVEAGDGNPADNVFTITSTFGCLPDLWVIVNDNIGPVPKAVALAYERAGGLAGLALRPAGFAGLAPSQAPEGVPHPYPKGVGPLGWGPPGGVQPAGLAGLAPDDPDPRLCVSPGELITYSVGYGNAGLVTATNVVLTETVPAYTTYAGGPEWTCAAGTCVRAVGTLEPGMGGIVPFVVRLDSVPPDLRVEDQVFIGGAEEDAYPPDNESNDDTPICDRCLQLSKDDNTSCAFPGDQIVYTISFTNTCAEPAAGIVLTEALPAYTHYMTSPGWLPQGGGQFAYPYSATLAPGASDSVEFAVLVQDPLPPAVVETVNVVCIGRQSGGTAVNCFTLVTPLPLETDLRVVKKDWVEPPPAGEARAELDRYHRILYGEPAPDAAAAPLRGPVGPGDVYSYTITYLNLGRAPATGVVLTETLPAHTTYVGYGWQQIGPSTYISRVGDLDVHSGGQVNFWLRVNGNACSSNGYLVNWVRIGGDQVECNLTNNRSREDTQADLPICRYGAYLPIVFKGHAAPPPPPPPPPNDGAYVSDVAVNPVTNRVYVASPWLDSVFAVDPTDDDEPILATIPVGRDPWGLAVITTTNKIYAANFKSNNVTPIRGSDHTPGANITVGVEPCKVAADSQDERVYVTHHKEPDRGAAAIDGEDDTFEYYYERVRAQAAYGIDVDRAADVLFVATRDAGLIAIHDAYEPLGDWTWIKLEPIRVPFVVAFNPATGHLLVTALDEVTGQYYVVVLDPYGIEWDKGRWVWIDSLPVFVLNRTNAGWIAEVEVGDGAEDGIAVNPETNLVYVTNTQDGTVTVIQDAVSAADIEWVATVEVGEYPMGIDVDVTRNLIYAGNAGSRDLSVIDGETQAVVDTIPLY